MEQFQLKQLWRKVHALTNDASVKTGEKLFLPIVNFVTAVSGDSITPRLCILWFCGQKLRGEVPFSELSISLSSGDDSCRPSDLSLELGSGLASPDNLSAPGEQFLHCRPQQWEIHSGSQSPPYSLHQPWQFPSLSCVEFGTGLATLLLSPSTNSSSTRFFLTDIMSFCITLMSNNCTNLQ